MTIFFPAVLFLFCQLASCIELFSSLGLHLIYTCDPTTLTCALFLLTLSLLLHTTILCFFVSSLQLHYKFSIFIRKCSSWVLLDISTHFQINTFIYPLETVSPKNIYLVFLYLLLSLFSSNFLELFLDVVNIMKSSIYIINSLMFFIIDCVICFFILDLLIMASSAMLNKTPFFTLKRINLYPFQVMLFPVFNKVILVNLINFLVVLEL